MDSEFLTLDFSSLVTLFHLTECVLFTERYARGGRAAEAAEKMTVSRLKAAVAD